MRAKLFCVGLLLLAAWSLQAQPLDQRQSQLLVSKCLQCHANPHTGAPQLGVVEDWQAVLAQGEDATLVNVVQGVRGMPPLGYCSACDEGDLRVLIRSIAGFPGREAQ